MKSVACALLMTLLVVICTVEAQGPCICTANYDPVCGSNGRTFGNSCQLNCERARNPGLRLNHRGECRNEGVPPRPTPRPPTRQPQQGCFCTFQYEPVCGTDGRTYGNSCQLGCQSNARVAYRGECRGGRGRGGSGITSV